MSDPVENLVSLHKHEEDLRVRIVDAIKGDAALMDHRNIVSEAMNLIYAFYHARATAIHRVSGARSRHSWCLAAVRITIQLRAPMSTRRSATAGSSGIVRRFIWVFTEFHSRRSAVLPRSPPSRSPRSHGLRRGSARARRWKWRFFPPAPRRHGGHVRPSSAARR